MKGYFVLCLLPSVALCYQHSYVDKQDPQFDIQVSMPTQERQLCGFSDEMATFDLDLVFSARPRNLSSGFFLAVSVPRIEITGFGVPQGTPHVPYCLENGIISGDGAWSSGRPVFEDAAGVRALVFQSLKPVGGQANAGLNFSLKGLRVRQRVVDGSAPIALHIRLWQPLTSKPEALIDKVVSVGSFVKCVDFQSHPPVDSQERLVLTNPHARPVTAWVENDVLAFGPFEQKAVPHGGAVEVLPSMPLSLLIVRNVEGGDLDLVNPSPLDRDSLLIPHLARSGEWQNDLHIGVSLPTRMFCGSEGWLSFAEFYPGRHVYTIPRAASIDWCSVGFTRPVSAFFSLSKDEGISSCAFEPRMAARSRWASPALADGWTGLSLCNTESKPGVVHLVGRDGKGSITGSFEQFVDARSTLTGVVNETPGWWLGDAAWIEVVSSFRFSGVTFLGYFGGPVAAIEMSQPSTDLLFTHPEATERRDSDVFLINTGKAHVEGRLIGHAQGGSVVWETSIELESMSCVEVSVPQEVSHVFYRGNPVVGQAITISKKRDQLAGAPGIPVSLFSSQKRGVAVTDISILDYVPVLPNNLGF